MNLQEKIEELEKELKETKEEIKEKDNKIEELNDNIYELELDKDRLEDEICELEDKEIDKSYIIYALDDDIREVISTGLEKEIGNYKHYRVILSLK